MTKSWLRFTILYNVMCAFLMDTYGLFSALLSIRAHQTFGLKTSYPHDIFFLGRYVISSEWQMTTSWTKQAGGFFSYEAVLFISPLSSHWQNINMHVENWCRLSLFELGGEEHHSLQTYRSWIEQSSLLRDSLLQWSFQLVIRREMRIPVARNG